MIFKMLLGKNKICKKKVKKIYILKDKLEKIIPKKAKLLMKSFLIKKNIYFTNFNFFKVSFIFSWFTKCVLYIIIVLNKTQWTKDIFKKSNGATVPVMYSIT